MQALVDAAPKLIDFLGAESKAHFDGLQALLLSQNQPFKINPRLVRGLDYYNLSVFEWVADDGLTICGGGRYDPLIAMLGGKDAPACGFAMGVERVLDLMRAAANTETPALCDVYVVHNGGATDAAALQAAERMRDTGVDVLCHHGGGSFKSQFKRADASGAVMAVVIGTDELAAGEVSIKWLRETAGRAAPPTGQQRVAMADVADYVIDALLSLHQQGDDDEDDGDDGDDDSEDEDGAAGPAEPIRYQ
jgi:histidyl-tRNA synthetase